MNNSHRRYQPISARQVQACWDFADRLKAHYAGGGSPNSRAVTGPWQADRREFALGKAAECSAALCFGLDPNPGPRCPIKWTVDDGPDGGSDLITPTCIRIDVKGSTPRGNLIWPLTKNGFYLSKHFHILLAVSVAEQADDLTQCWIEGFVTKQEFFELKKIASTEFGPRLTPGTWYLEKHLLRPLHGRRAPIDLLMDTLGDTPPVINNSCAVGAPVNSRDGVDAVSEFVRSGERLAFADIWADPFKDGGA